MTDPLVFLAGLALGAALYRTAPRDWSFLRRPRPGRLAVEVLVARSATEPFPVRGETVAEIMAGCAAALALSYAGDELPGGQEPVAHGYYAARTSLEVVLVPAPDGWVPGREMDGGALRRSVAILCQAMEVRS